MEHIKISLADVNDLAFKINLINNQIYEQLLNAKNKMNELNAIWESDGSSAIRTRFNILSNKFDTQKEVIDSYSKFLNHLVNTYDSLESTIVFNANSINE